MALRIVGLLLCVVGAGCSFALDGPPADYEPRRHGRPICDREAGGLAVLDGLGIAIAMLPPAIGAAVVIDPRPEGALGDGVALVAGGAFLAVVGVTSLALGSRVTARCEKAHLDFQRWVSDSARVSAPSPARRRQ